MADEEQLNEIKAQLAALRQDQRALVLVRSAMRLLPLLADTKQKGLLGIGPKRKAFAYWKNEKARHLLSVFKTYPIVFRYTVSDGNAAAYAAAAAAADAAYAYATYAAAAADAAYAYAYAAAAYAADAAAYAADAADAAYAADAAAYAADAADAAYAADAYAGHDYLKTLALDISTITLYSIEAYLEQPLWIKPPSAAWQAQLEVFKTDVLSLKAGFEVWLDWYDQRLAGKAIDRQLLEQWLNCPPEITSQGPAHVNAHLKNLREKTAIRPLNRVRAIFIGHGEAGKTSLINALNGLPVVENKQEMTAGIEIKDWQLPGSDIKAHFWDFGGQVMAHATHQFFLRTSCLYVVVLNARSEIDGTQQAEYWLEHVKAFGQNAPVMVVGNKADLADVNLDMAYLKSKYANIIGYYPLSCTEAQKRYKAKFESFKQDFCEQLTLVGTHQILFTSQQFAVIQGLMPYQQASAFIKKQDFADLCKQQGIEAEGLQNKDWLLDIFDKLGLVIHFPKLACLDDYVLNPRWLTKGVYSIMYHRQAQITQAEVVELLRTKPIYDENGLQLEYPPDKCRFIIDAMQEFKLCYLLQHSPSAMMIPELLATDQPSELAFDKLQALAFEFVFRGFLPRHVMPEFIVNRHLEIHNETVWQCGVWLKPKTANAEALVKVDYHDRVLAIWVTGADAKDYLNNLIDEVLKILGRLELEYEERIALPAAACMSETGFIRNQETASYRQLLAQFKHGYREFISTSGLRYDLAKVLKLIIPDANLQAYINHYEDKRMNIHQTISHSTIMGSVLAAEKIEHCFNSLSESKAPGEVTQLLAQLLTEIKALNGKVPAGQAQQLEDIAGSAQNIIEETKRQAPRAKWYHANLEGIKDAAVALGAFAKPVLELAEKLAPLLIGAV